MPEHPIVVLAVNIGSSSIKYAAYAAAGVERTNAMTPITRGLIERPDQREATFDQALRELDNRLSRELKGASLAAISHRVVHGGQHNKRSVLVTEQVLHELHALDRLAPLHQPFNLQGIAAFSKAFPGVAQIACFDTAFHASLSETEKAFPLTRQLFDQGIRRYGFHGLSYQYVSETLAQRSPAAKGRLLMAHLGNGASLCACINGKSVATTMGFSAAGGLMMGTRCGDLDPGVMLYLMQEGQDARALEQLVYRDSGLKGMSTVSSDMRVLRQSPAPEAAFAIALFESQIIRESGGLIAQMGGVDALAFTGGIGENDLLLRQRVCEQLAFLGVSVDPTLNAQAVQHTPQAIHHQTSEIEVWVVPTDEGMIAAREALAYI